MQHIALHCNQKMTEHVKLEFKGMLDDFRLEFNNFRMPFGEAGMFLSCIPSSPAAYGPQLTPGPSLSSREFCITTLRLANGSF